MAGLTWTGLFNSGPLLSAFSNAQTQISNRMKAISSSIAKPESMTERWVASVAKLPTVLAASFGSALAAIKKSDIRSQGLARHAEILRDIAKESIAVNQNTNLMKRSLDEYIGMAGASGDDISSFLLKAITEVDPNDFSAFFVAMAQEGVTQSEKFMDVLVSAMTARPELTEELAKMIGQGTDQGAESYAASLMSAIGRAGAMSSELAREMVEDFVTNANEALSANPVEVKTEASMGGAGIAGAFGALTGSLGAVAGSFKQLARTALTAVGPFALLMKAIMPLFRMLENMLLPLFVPIENAITSLMMTSAPLVYKLVPALQNAMVTLVPYARAVINVFASLLMWMGKSKVVGFLVKAIIWLVIASKALAVALWLIALPLKFVLFLTGAATVLKTMYAVVTAKSAIAVWKENAANTQGTISTTANNAALVLAIAWKTALTSVTWAYSFATKSATRAKNWETISTWASIKAKKVSALATGLNTLYLKAYIWVIKNSTIATMADTITKWGGIVAEKVNTTALWLGILAKKAYLLITGQVSAATIWNTLCRWKSTAAGVANTAAIWLANSATAVYTAVIDGSSVALIWNTVCKWKNTAATYIHSTALWLGTAVTSVWTAVIGISSVALIWNTVCKWGSAAASFALNAAIGVGVGVVALYNAVLVTASTVTGAFTAALYANPIGMIVIGVIAVVAAVVLLVRWIGNSTSSFTKLGKIILTALSPVLFPIILLVLAVKKLWHWIVGGSPGLIPAFKMLGKIALLALFPVLMPLKLIIWAVKKLWAWIGPVLIPAFKMLGKIASFVLSPWLVLFRQVIGAVKKLWHWIVGGSPGLIPAFKMLGKIALLALFPILFPIKLIVLAVKGLFGLLGSAKKIFSGISLVIENTFGRVSGVVASTMDMFVAPFNWLSDKFTWLMNKIEWFAKKWDWLKGKVSWLWGGGDKAKVIQEGIVKASFGDASITVAGIKLNEKEMAKYEELKKASFGDVPTLKIGGIEASKEKFAQYELAKKRLMFNVGESLMSSKYSAIGKRMKDSLYDAVDSVSAKFKLDVEKPQPIKVDTEDVKLAQSSEHKETLQVLRLIADRVDNKLVVDSVDKLRGEAVAANADKKDEEFIANQEIDLEVLDVAEFS